MSGHGRYPRARLNAMPLAVAARHVFDRIAKRGATNVYIVPTTGIVMRDANDPRVPDPVRYRFVGQFDTWFPVREIAEALAPLCGTKICGRCDRNLPLTAFNITKEGHPRSQCRQCAAAKCAQRRREVSDGLREPRRKRIKPYVPAHVPNPLNALLRDMPGSRVSLLGIAGVRIADELGVA